MKRVFILITAVLVLFWSSVAAGDPTCYIIKVPVPDGGEPIEVEVCV